MSRIRDRWPDKLCFVVKSLDKQFVAFLHKKRGEMSQVAFAKKLGISRASLYRLLQGDESITLKRLDSILKRLRCPTSEVFLDEKNEG